jgi:hypothetical protein
MGCASSFRMWSRSRTQPAPQTASTCAHVSSLLPTHAALDTTHKAHRSVARIKSKSAPRRAYGIRGVNGGSTQSSASICEADGLPMVNVDGRHAVWHTVARTHSRHSARTPSNRTIVSCSARFADPTPRLVRATSSALEQFGSRRAKVTAAASLCESSERCPWPSCPTPPGFNVESSVTVVETIAEFDGDPQDAVAAIEMTTESRISPRIRIRRA